MVSIIVIGAGPAGFCAAISAARTLGMNGSVLLLESGDESGRKLLLSGSGQCNYTNVLEREQFLKRLGIYAMYLKPAFYAFNNDALTALLEDGGCETTVREDGKAFPASFRATDVRRTFMLQMQRAHAELKLNTRVVDIKKLDYGFELALNKNGINKCGKLILCSGGASYPKTGSDGKAVQMLTSLGHNPVLFRPHLTGVSIYDFGRYKPCAGISLRNVQARFKAGSGMFEAGGDLLITHQGFSGPLILDNSHRLAKGDRIEINWCPEIASQLTEMLEQNKRMTVINGLWHTHIPPNLLRAILNAAHFDSLKMSEIGKKERKFIITSLTQSRYEIKSLGSLATSMASAGGIPLSEINAKTMESRVCPGLFFAGEVMDYALPSGGFNIQIACSTGWLAGENAAKSCL